MSRAVIATAKNSATVMPRTPTNENTATSARETTGAVTSDEPRPRGS